MIYRKKHESKHKYDWMNYLACVELFLGILLWAIYDYESLVARPDRIDTVSKNGFLAGLDMIGGRILVFAVIIFCLMASAFGTILSWQKRKW